MSSDLKVTSAEEYADITRKAAEKSDVGQVVLMPTGAVFRLRRAKVEEMAMIGELPQSLVETGLKAWQKRGIAPPPKPSEPEEVDPEQSIQQLIFLRQTVVENCLEPRIGYDERGIVSLLDKDGKAIAKCDPKDFIYAFRWITHQEGVGADGPSIFRNRQQRRAAASGSNRKKLRSPALASTKSD